MSKIMPVNAGKKQANKKNSTSFKKGQSGNPKGKVKGSVDFISQLKAVIKEVEKEKGISLIKFAVQKAYTNPQVLIAILKKIIPDISKSDVQVESTYNAAYSEYDNMTDEEILKDFERELKGYKSSIQKDSPVEKN